MRLKIIFALLMYIIYICGVKQTTPIDARPLLKEKRDLYISIVPESYSFIMARMGWNHNNSIYANFNPKKRISRGRFEKIKSAFEDWKKSEGRVDSLRQEPVSLDGFEQSAISGGKYDFYKMMSETRKFLNQ